MYRGIKVFSTILGVETAFTVLFYVMYSTTFTAVEPVELLQASLLSTLVVALASVIYKVL